MKIRSIAQKIVILFLQPRRIITSSLSRSNNAISRLSLPIRTYLLLLPLHSRFLLSFQSARRDRPEGEIVAFFYHYSLDLFDFIRCVDTTPRHDSQDTTPKGFKATINRPSYLRIIHFVHRVSKEGSSLSKKTTWMLSSVYEPERSRTSCLGNSSMSSGLPGASAASKEALITLIDIWRSLCSDKTKLVFNKTKAASRISKTERQES